MTSLFDNIDLDLLPSARLLNRRTAERLASDWLPCCPKCGEFNHQGAVICSSCSARLVGQAGRGKHQGGQRLTLPRPALYTCPNCLTDSAEDWCSGCGRTLGKAA